MSYSSHSTRRAMRTGVVLCGRHLMLVLACTAVVAVVAVVGCSGGSESRNGHEASVEPSSGTRPDLVLISYDTVRQDHLSLYGYHRSTSPNLDRLAELGVTFDQAFSAETNTNPSHATMFTGLYPHEHESRANGHLLREDVVTLAERLRAVGYRTGAFVSGAPMKAAASRLDQGFAHYDDAFDDVRRNGAVTTDRALAWLEQDDQRPRFMFVHLYDAHGPYLPTREELAAFEPSEPGRQLTNITEYQRLTTSDGQPLTQLGPYVDRYDALLLRLDGLLERVLQSIDLSNTFVVVLSDHGESLDERHRQLDHGTQVFDEQIRIPLVIAGPGLVAQRVGEPVETVDLLPTVLSLLDVSADSALSDDPIHLPGVDLGPRIRSAANGEAEDESERLVFSSARTDAHRHGNTEQPLYRSRRVSSVQEGPWKLIVYPGRAETYFELYDLNGDPAETLNVLAQQRDVARRLFSRLEEWNPKHNEPVGMVNISNELRQQLEALGYL